MHSQSIAPPTWTDLFNQSSRISSQSQELEALEARLRETEERLKQRQSRTSSPAGTAGNGANSPQRRKPLGTTFSGQENDRLQTSTTSPLATTQNAGSQSLSPSTMSRWGPTVKDDRSEAENTGNMPVGRSSGLQDSGYSE
ncbi:hypothetical protein MMC28_003926 [Mycoblastus sanguinarius]|nr:hypothetical protein [Mycoblastus sanguinarius]